MIQYRSSTARHARIVSLLAMGALGMTACDEGAQARGESPQAGAGSQAAHATPTVGLDSARLASAHARLEGRDEARSLVVARDGVVEAEWYFNGRTAADRANLKSVSKSILSALVGIAIAEGALEGVDEPIAPWFTEEVPADPDPRLARVTIGHLLSMRAGLGSTSFGNYGAWVTSRNWVRSALARPFEDEPGGRMLYSTGSTHLLSALLTRATGVDTWTYARDRLADPLGIELRPWQRDPQGIYFGGNDMLMRPRDLLRIGELYRNGGVVEGREVIPRAWIEASWTPRTTSPWNGHGYGYGWWSRRLAGRDAYFAWGYGGQYLFIVPSLRLTIVATSDPAPRPGRRGYRSELMAAIEDVVRAAETGRPPATPAGAAGAGGVAALPTPR